MIAVLGPHVRRYAAAAAPLLRGGHTRVVADLRSDTVTVPTAGMLQAMAEARVGDDVYDEDEGVHALQNKVALLCGKEAGLFCATGTMSNQIGLALHLGPLEAVLCDARAHVYRYEAGGIALHSRATAVPVQPAGAHLEWGELEPRIEGGDVHYATTRAISLESPLGGAVMPLANMRAIGAGARQAGLAMHLDGARLWNAAVELQCGLDELCAEFDTVSLCLSKGLGAPIGSMLVGSSEAMARARHLRKAFGGGWRQAGVLAAAAEYAIDHHWPQMAEDHRRCKDLFRGLEALGVTGLQEPETNILFLSEGCGIALDRWVAELREKDGILVASRYDGGVRVVTHHQVGDHVIEAMQRRAGECLKA